MKKLRLVVTDVCHRNCEGCCNKDIRLRKIISSITEYSNYDMIMITGGEPFLFPSHLRILLLNLVPIMSRIKKSKIILYTALFPKRFVMDEIFEILSLLDGITFTIHDQEGIADFIRLNETLRVMGIKISSKRLNIFCDVPISPINLYEWDVKFIDWIKNCPLPKNEELGKLDVLWTINHE